MQVYASEVKMGDYLEEEERKEEMKEQRKEQMKEQRKEKESRELPCQQEPMLEEEQRREPSPFTCNI